MSSIIIEDITSPLFVHIRTILSEIDDIRLGRWDGEIKARVTGIPAQDAEPKVEVTVCGIFNFSVSC